MERPPVTVLRVRESRKPASKLRFATLMGAQAPRYLELCRGPVDDKVLEQTIDALAEKPKREAFLKRFRALEVLYEIISPDVSLRDYLDDYAKLSILYEVVSNAFGTRVALYREVAKKTEWLIRERAASFSVMTAMPLVTIDEQALATLRKEGGASNAKVRNLGKSLVRAAAEEGERSPTSCRSAGGPSRFSRPTKIARSVPGAGARKRAYRRLGADSECAERLFGGRAAPSAA